MQTASLPDGPSAKTVPGTSSPSTAGAQGNAPLSRDRSQGDAAVPQVRLPNKNATVMPSMPIITLPPGMRMEELEFLKIPPLPYSIFNDIYRTVKESETTQRELLIHFFQSYIVPVDITGNIAQSLYGVSQDGMWFCIFIGHFPTKNLTRDFLGMLMDERPDDQPEIMKFTYAAECGRFLDPEAAKQLQENLHRDGFYPYTQLYPTNDGKSLARIMVGCFFSEQGAQSQKNHLADRGYSCKVAER